MRDNANKMSDNANKMRDRLIELIMKTPRLPIIIKGRKQGKTYQTVSNIADHLLANGVLVAPMPMADWLRDELSEYINKRCFEEL